jgi:hypothetical protein
MGGAKRYPSIAFRGGDGFREGLHPSLYGAVEVKRQSSQRSSFSNRAYQFLGSAEGVSSSRPRFCRAPRAAVVEAGRHCGGAADCVVSRPRLDDGEPGAKLDGRDDRSRSTAKVILDWAVNDACGNTASPCIRSGTKARYHNPSCTGEGKAQQRRDPYVDGPLVARVCSCDSDRLRSYVRSVVAVAHDRCQDGFRDARSKHPHGVFCQWVPRIFSRLGIDRSHSSTRASSASGMRGKPHAELGH